MAQAINEKVAAVFKKLTDMETHVAALEKANGLSPATQNDIYGNDKEFLQFNTPSDRTLFELNKRLDRIGQKQTPSDGIQREFRPDQNPPQPLDDGFGHPDEYYTNRDITKLENRIKLMEVAGKKSELDIDQRASEFLKTAPRTVENDTAMHLPEGLSPSAGGMKPRSNNTELS